MKTPIQELIEKFQKEWDKHGMGSGISYSSLIHSLEEALPKEREVIEGAHDKANENWSKGHPTPITSGGVYFDKTFESDESKS